MSFLVSPAARRRWVKALDACDLRQVEDLLKTLKRT